MPQVDKSYKAPYKTVLEAMAWIDSVTEGGHNFHGNAFWVMPVEGGFGVVQGLAEEVPADKKEVSRTV